MTVVHTTVKDTQGDSYHVRYSGIVVAATSMQGAIDALQAEITNISATPPATTPTKVNAAMSPYTVLGTDFILECDTSTGAIVINLQPVANRNRNALAIKDAGLNASNNNITINGQIDNQNPRVLNADGQAINVRPNHDLTAYEEVPW